MAAPGPWPLSKTMAAVVLSASPSRSRAKLMQSLRAATMPGCHTSACHRRARGPAPRFSVNAVCHSAAYLTNSSAACRGLIPLSMLLIT